MDANDAYDATTREHGPCPYRDDDEAGFCRWQAAMFERVADLTSDPLTRLMARKLAERFRASAAERPALLCRN